MRKGGVKEREEESEGRGRREDEKLTRRFVSFPFFQSIHEDMSAHSLEALEMISKGFHTLKTSDPELAYSVIADLLAGIHEFVLPFLSSSLLSLAR